MNSLIEQGCLDIWIDEIVPCLKDTATGELKDTVVFKIESRSYLRKFKAKDGWHINWNEIPGDVEVYALALHDTNEIQGLVGVKNDVYSKAAYIHWHVQRHGTINMSLEVKSMKASEDTYLQ